MVITIKKFLIQTINNQIVHDFCFYLVEAIKFNNWFNNEKLYDYTLSEKVDNYENFIPVGSLDFVFNYIETYYNISKNKIHPINVPKQLNNYEFLKRKVFISDKKDLILLNKMFIKSNTQYKKFTDIVNDINLCPDDQYFISEIINIDSEWRGFVQHKQLVGLKHYSGDFKVFPNINFIEKIIQTYTDCPSSYTLDIGINNNDNFLIEIHPFVSCGLYGFNNPKLPSMFIQGFNYLIKK